MGLGHHEPQGPQPSLDSSPQGPRRFSRTCCQRRSTPRYPAKDVSRSMAPPVGHYLAMDRRYSPCQLDAHPRPRALSSLDRLQPCCAPLNANLPSAAFRDPAAAPSPAPAHGTSLPRAMRASPLLSPSPHVSGRWLDSRGRDVRPLNRASAVSICCRKKSDAGRTIRNGMGGGGGGASQPVDKHPGQRQPTYATDMTTAASTA